MNSPSPPRMPILTIFIPTYNRSHRVRALVSYLLPLVNSAKGRIEIVVSNNCSTDGAKVLLSELSSSYLRIVHREHHAETAEEHIFRSTSEWRGEYVWFHGDDDVTFLDTVNWMLPVLETREFDFLCFNAAISDRNGSATSSRSAWLNAYTVEVDFAKGMFGLGFKWGAAGISNIVQRRSKLLGVDALKILERAPVYAHVAWWLQAFKGCGMLIVNRPLVLYRVDSGDNTLIHFDKYAKKYDIPSYSYWTSGLIDLFKYLIDADAITAEDVRSAYDFSPEGTFFRLLDSLVHFIQAQVILGIANNDNRNRISGRSLQDMADWILSIDYGYYEFMQIIYDIHATRSEPKRDVVPRGYVPSIYVTDFSRQEPMERLTRLSAIFDTMMSHRIASTNHLVTLVGQHLGYAIHRHISGYVAFDTEQAIDQLYILRWFDITPKDTSILVQSSMERLLCAISDVRKEQFASVVSGNTSPIQHTSATMLSRPNELNDKIRVLSDGDYDAAVRRLEASTMRSDRKAQTKWLFDRFASRKHQGQDHTGFNEAFYVESNPDLDFSKIDPFYHFSTVGWKEGRDPSAAFSVKGYLAANPDVEKAGVAPLRHFLDHGRTERRKGWY